MPLALALRNVCVSMEGVKDGELMTWLMMSTASKEKQCGVMLRAACEIVMRPEDLQTVQMDVS